MVDQPAIEVNMDALKAQVLPLCRGIPGAIVVCAEIFKVYDFPTVKLIYDCLEKKQIYGSDIWVLYKNNDKILDKFVAHVTDNIVSDIVSDNVSDNVPDNVSDNII